MRKVSAEVSMSGLVNIDDDCLDQTILVGLNPQVLVFGSIHQGACHFPVAVS